MKTIILEDNVVLAKNIAWFLKLKWIKAEIDFDGVRWYEKVLNNHYDVLILDINLPWMDGMTICKKLREKENPITILMLTSRNTKKDIVEGLDVGADDYLWKPFDFEELFARLEALYRRTANNKSAEIKIKDIEIDIKKRLVVKNWQSIKLSTLEFDLLKYLAQNRGQPIDRKELFENVWGDFDAHMFSRSVDVYIWYLRKKLWEDLIITRKWFWYLIE